MPRAAIPFTVLALVAAVAAARPFAATARAGRSTPVAEPPRGVLELRLGARFEVPETTYLDLHAPLRPAEARALAGYVAPRRITEEPGATPAPPPRGRASGDYR